MTRYLLATLAFASFVVAPATALAGAPADISTVRYSYESWSRAGQRRFVLVPAPAKLKPATMPDRTRALFKQLVGAKRNTYGDARLAFKPDAVKTGIVYVYLDAKKAKYNAIVMAETVYTFTENGASKVVFPKVQAQGWTRADVPFPAYVLNVPLWEGLPPANYGQSLLQMPDGTLLPADVVMARLKSGDKAAVDAMWQYVEKGPVNASIAAIKAGGILKLSDLEARLMPVLNSANTALRLAALKALKGHDNATVNTALREVMDEDKEAEVRDVAAGLLSTSKDPKYATAAQYHALRSADPKVVAVAAKALGENNLPEAKAHLVKALAHADGAARAAAVASLIKRGEQSELTQALTDTTGAPERKIEIATALAADTAPGPRLAGLRFLAVHATGAASSDAAAALADTKDAESRAALGAALLHKESDTRTAAAESLTAIGDAKALPLLAKGDLTDAESGADLVAAIRTLYRKQKIDFVLKGTRDKTPALKQAAVATLGAMIKAGAKKRDQKRVIETLRPLMKDSDAAVRAAVAESFGIMGNEKTRKDVVTLAADPAIEVKRAAAAALGSYPGAPIVKLLLGFSETDDARLLASTLSSLGRLEEREALNAITANLNHKDSRVRRAATDALARVGAKLDKRKPLLSFFSERLFDKDAEVRLLAVRGLVLVKDPRTVTAMAALLQDPEMRVRKATLMAMADTQDAGAVNAIASTFESDDVSLRRVAIEALKRSGRKEAIKVLYKYAETEKDAALVKAAKAAAKTLQTGR